MNQTLMNTTRCLLLESGLSSKFWAEAVSTAAYLRNKCPSTATNGDIPERIWSGKDVNMNHIKVFGCRTWSHVRSHAIKSKLDPKAKECVLVGYPDGVKGYKLWDIKGKSFFISRDVIFEENIFPYKEERFQKQSEESAGLYIEDREIDIRITSPSESETNNTTEVLSHSYEEPSSNNENTIGTIEQNEEMLNHNTDDHNEDNTIPQYRDQSNRSRKVPNYLNEYILYNAEETERAPEVEECKIPTTVKEALASIESKMWQRAMKEEIENLQNTQTWELVTKPAGVKLITSRWLFRKKKDDTGNHVKFKARLVARGYLQVPGIDFQETFSPVIKLKSIRILLAIAAEMDFDVHQMDITAAYLNGILEEDIYMTQPEGCIEEGKEHLVCHLKKSLYGLKQSGRVWNSCLDEFLTQYGLRRTIADPCIYYNCERSIIIGIYVDDLIIIGQMQEIRNFKQEIKNKFKAKDLGPANLVLSMKISRCDDGSITLDQTTYAAEILETFKMSEAKPATTPLDPSIHYHKIGDNRWNDIKEESAKIPYRQAIGSFLYLACGTRPDLAYASTYMSQFNDRPDEEHWRGVKHMFRYLKGTKSRKLMFRKTGKQLQVYSDADWGGDTSDRKSFSGYMLLLAGAPVSWSSKKQTITALSSTEAEYVAMCHVAKEVLWINSLLRELSEKFICTPQSIFVDNQGAIFIAKNNITSERSKHIDVKYFFLRDLVHNNTIKFEHVPSTENLADLLTKRVPKRVLKNLNHGLTHLG